ncbi:hypothetical protein BC831DRAFT_103728 [Entophlyctis helioformis]|nr:hypothetical protein BC831DRAFT_103728 [Entophlyctis helioformis]
MRQDRPVCCHAPADQTEIIEPTADANSCAARVLFAAALAFLAKLGCCCEWRSSRTACRHFQNFGGGMSIGPSCSVPLLQRSSLHDCRSTAQIASKPAVPPAASTAPQLRRNCAKRPGCDTRLASMNVPSCTTSACRPSSKQMPNSISTACRSGAMPTLLNSGRSSMHASMCVLASARVSPANSVWSPMSSTSGAVRCDKPSAKLLHKGVSHSSSLCRNVVNLYWRSSYRSFAQDPATASLGAQPTRRRARMCRAVARSAAVPVLGTASTNSMPWTIQSRLLATLRLKPHRTSASRMKAVSIRISREVAPVRRAGVVSQMAVLSCSRSVSTGMRLKIICAIRSNTPCASARLGMLTMSSFHRESAGRPR